MLSIHLCLGLRSGLFPSGFPTNNLYTFLFFSIRATCPAHLILLDFIILIILGEEWTWNSALLEEITRQETIWWGHQVKIAPICWESARTGFATETGQDEMEEPIFNMTEPHADGSDQADPSIELTVISVSSPLSLFWQKLNDIVVSVCDSPALTTNALTNLYETWCMHHDICVHLNGVRTSQIFFISLCVHLSLLGNGSWKGYSDNERTCKNRIIMRVPFLCGPCCIKGKRVICTPRTFFSNRILRKYLTMPVIGHYRLFLNPLQFIVHVSFVLLMPTRFIV
jgi:hypothetical protein